MSEILDSIIIGSGPAGLSAAVYGKRAALSLTVVEKEYEGTGQIAESARVDNYLGLPGIDGYELGEKFREHALKLGVDFVEQEVVKIEPVLTPEKEKLWLITFADDSLQLAKTVIYAAGASPRRLGVPGESEYAGKGVSFCAICDGSFYKDKVVAVIGGGDTALDDALYLSKISKKVYLIHRRDEFRGAAKSVELVRKTDNIELILHATVEEIRGGNKVSGLVLQDGKELEVDGIFLAIGSVPQTHLLKGLTALDEQGYVIADESGRTECDGLFVAGDVRTKSLRQVVTAVADGASAVTSAVEYLRLM